MGCAIAGMEGLADQQYGAREYKKCFHMSIKRLLEGQDAPFDSCLSVITVMTTPHCWLLCCLMQKACLSRAAVKGTEGRQACACIPWNCNQRGLHLVVQPPVAPQM